MTTITTQQSTTYSQAQQAVRHAYAWRTTGVSRVGGLPAPATHLGASVDTGSRVVVGEFWKTEWL